MTETAVNQTPDYPQNITPEKIWAILQEVSESQKETAKQMKETDRMVGELSNRFGELAEHLVAPNITEKFNELGFTFENIYQNNRIKDSSGNYLAEIDLVLENGDIVMAV